MRLCLAATHFRSSHEHIQEPTNPYLCLHRRPILLQLSPLDSSGKKEKGRGGGEEGEAAL